jgi:hypothetical protein
MDALMIFCLVFPLLRAALAFVNAWDPDKKD